MVHGHNNANQQDESVYNLIPRTEVRAAKPIRYNFIKIFIIYISFFFDSYESKFRQNVRESFKDGKHEHRTMGYADEPLPDPQQFLKKQQTNTKPNVSKDGKEFFIYYYFHKLFISSILKVKETSSTNQAYIQRKPAVPSIRDAPKMGTRTEKNFVQTNALDVVMTVPKKPERNIVDDRYGDKYPIDQSGLTPKYIFKKVFIFKNKFTKFDFLFCFFLLLLFYRILVKFLFI